MRIQKPLNRLNRRPRYLFAFDTETSEEPINETESSLVWKLGCGIYYDRETGERATIGTEDKQAFIRFMLSHVPKRGTLWVYAHNIYFDFKVSDLHIELPKAGFKLDWFYFGQGGGNAIIVFKRSQQTIKFINTFNYFPMKLEKIGELVGLPKLEVDFSVVDNEQLLTYCMRDTEIVVKAMVLFHDTIENHLGVSVGYTAGSTSYIAWTNSQDGQWVQFHDDDALGVWERNAYKGGRTEAFKLGRIGQTVHCLDVNSMYPYVMLSYPMPCRIVKAFGIKSHFEAIAGRDWWACLSRFVINKDHRLYLIRGGFRAGVMADCTLRVDEPAIGIIDKDKLIFPTGTFRATLSCCEFEYALERGWIEEIYAAEVWRMAYPFEDYISRVWALRNEFKASGNHGMSTAIKLVGNSLYGKFAQRKIIEVAREECDPALIHSEMAVIEGGAGMIWELCGQRVFMLTSKEPTNRTHYPIASEITAAARLTLWRYINEAGRKNVYYCDTDSLFVNDVGLDMLSGNIGSELGELKLEWTDNKLTIYGLKDYQTSTKVKRKGVKSDAVFIEALNAWQQTQFVGIRGDLQRGNQKGILIRKVNKTLKRQYTKGRVQSDGRVLPFELA